MSIWTRVFLTALRIAVGWHFLYEGQWKIDSDTGATSYLPSRYTLQASTGRLRDYFERTSPEELKLESALTRADEWYDEIVKAFAARKALGDDQKARLADLRDKVKIAASGLIRGQGMREDVVNFDWQYVHEEILKIAGEEDGERFTSLPFLQGSAGPLRPLFRSFVPDIAGLDRLTIKTAHQRIDARCDEILHHFASAGQPLTPEQQTRLAAARDAIKASIAITLKDPAFQARMDDYKTMRDRVRADESRGNARFTQERLDTDRKKLDMIAGELLGFVNEPLVELAAQAEAIATVSQLGAGPFPRPKDQTQWIDFAIKCTLTLIGLSLLLGLFTRVGAIAAALQLAVFYLASPPWPGLPAAAMGGHYFFVDRNLIELIASLVIASTSTGTWAGLDHYVAMRFHTLRSLAVEEPVSVA